MMILTMMFDVGLAWLGLPWLSLACLGLPCLGSMSWSLATRTKRTIHNNLATLQISRAMIRVWGLVFMV